MRLAWIFLGVAAALVAGAPALAAPECLANGQSYQIGQAACLTPAGKSYLARCDVVLNNTSWTKIKDDCLSDGTPAQDDAKLPPEPALPSTKPSEPTAN